MNIREYTFKPSSLFQKEIRRVEISNITRSDYQEIYNLMGKLGALASQHETQLNLGHGLIFCESKNDWRHFKEGFRRALELQGIRIDVWQ
jgi:hypothetical protein